jgi:regulator of protease activity HflC (stomatin/prohibitin superfamily)
MLWLVITLALALAGIGAGIFGMKREIRVGVPALAGLLWVVLSVFFSIHTVGQRQVGIVYNFSGTIAGKSAKAPGVVTTWPWQHIRTENIAIQKETFVFDGSNSAVSKDQQPITATLVVNYEVEPQHVIGLYKTIGPNWKTVLLDGRVPQDFKETTAQFTSPEITLNRPALRKITVRRLREELGQYDVRVVDVFVNNVAYSTAYTNAIESKQVQVQQALQAQAKVAQSKAEAEQAIAKARGDAESIALKGRALRNNPQVLQLESIDKLNPNAQLIICTGTTCPSILPGNLVQGK